MVSREFRKLISLVALVAVMMTTVLVAGGAPAFAADQVPDYVTSNHWAKDNIDLLIKNNIAALDAKSAFNPNAKITRNDFNAMLTKAFGSAPTTTGSGTVKRQDAISELLYAAGIPTATPAADAFKNYTDASKINPWLARAVWGAIETGIIKGDGASLRPLEAMTRAEAATMIANARFRPINIVSTNDVHGTLSNDGSYVGSAVLAGYINSLRAKNPTGTLLLDAGDSMQGAMTSNLNFGKPMVEVMNALGYDAAGIGNHEFDWTTAKLDERAKQATYPLISANIFEKATGNRPTWAKPYTMIEKNGLKIGITGFISTETPSIVLAENIKDWDIKDPVAYINQYAKELRAQGADIVICIAHEGAGTVSNGVITGTIANLAKDFVGVDAIVGGHQHNTLAGTAAGIPFVSNKDKGRAVGNIELRYDVVTHKIVFTRTTNTVTAVTGAADPTIKAIADRYEAAVAPMKNEVLGTLAADLVRNYDGESGIGNWLADIMRSAAGTDFAFTNAGGVRADVTKGDITVGTIYSIMPFDNTLYTMKLTGAKIKDLLEQGAKLEKGMVQFSGLKFTYDPKLPVGSRVTSMTKLDGTPIDTGATYTVVTNDFMSTGGDNFLAFKDGTDRVNTYRLIRDEMIKWVKAETAAGRTVNPTVDGRLTVK